MPRYFFNVRDGAAILDEDGSILPDIAAVREQALRTTGELLRDMSKSFWDDPEWSLVVTNEAGREILTLRITGRSLDKA